MIRELLAAAAITGATIGVAPCAVADNGRWPGDVPGMNYDASLGAPCDNYERFIFGRGPSGQADSGTGDRSGDEQFANHDPPSVVGRWDIPPVTWRQA